MPSGDDVVSLLNHPALSDAFLRGLLRERGVFVKGVDRTHLIEQFVLTYLSPSEFVAILERLAAKEGQLKLKTFTYTLGRSDLELVDIVPGPDSLNVSEVAKDPYFNYRIEGAPSFVRESDTSFILEYDLVRENVGRNWIKTTERSTGKIRVIKDPNSKKLYLQEHHSTSDTKEVNSMVRRWIRASGEERKIFERESEKVLTFGDFTNRQRMEFLMYFTGDYPGEKFSFEKVTDFDFCVDDAKIPATESRLVWMKGEVSRSSLRGRRLHDLFVLKERAAWEFIKLWAIELRFKVSTADFDGAFSLSLEFDGYAASQSPKARFQLSVGQISSGKFRGSTEGVRRDIYRRIDFYVRNFADKALQQSEAEYSGGVSAP